MRALLLRALICAARNPTVTLVAVLHAVWGAGLLVDAAAVEGATPAHALALVVPNPLALALLLLTFPVMALWGLRGREARHFAAIMPQQFLLIASALGSGWAVSRGHYADGVPRPLWFILTDQLLVMLVAVWHAWSIFARARRWT